MWWEEFEGKSAIVSGGAQGIGEAVVRALAALRASVVIADLNEVGARELAEELVGAGGRVLAIGADVTQSIDANRLVEETLRAFERIDMLVNVAGGFTRPVPAEAISDREWDEVLRLNLTSAFLLCRAVLPHMKAAGRGRIVNVSSEAGRMPITLTGAHYAAAKAGVLGLTRHLAREAGPFGVTVNAVAPGTTLTPRVRAVHSENRMAWIRELTPLGRLADVKDQVGPILFLLSDGARYVTGATLDVTGGRIML